MIRTSKSVNAFLAAVIVAGSTVVVSADPSATVAARETASIDRILDVPSDDVTCKAKRSPATETTSSAMAEMKTSPKDVTTVRAAQPFGMAPQRDGAWCRCTEWGPGGTKCIGQMSCHPASNCPSKRMTRCSWVAP